MSKKKNIIPSILALISTLVLLGLGYGIVTQINSFNAAEDSGNSTKNGSSLTAKGNSNKTISAASFSAPGIVPMGISVKIDGTEEMSDVNQLLKRSFQKEFPGTAVSIDDNGGETGIKLLLSGQIDLAAIARPLDETELSQGLTAFTIEGKHLEEADFSNTDTLFYAYRQPANLKVEAFLGHLFSERGQKAIAER